MLVVIPAHNQIENLLQLIGEPRVVLEGRRR
jgi:hypothetical protein